MLAGRARAECLPAIGALIVELVLTDASSVAGALAPGVLVGIGLDAEDGFETRREVWTDGRKLQLDAPLERAHPAGEIVSTEFVRYRWYPDAHVGTSYLHDHVHGLSSKRHGLFGALVPAINDVHTIHIDGHPVRIAVHIGTSERYDLVVPAAGGSRHRSGDYLYRNGRPFKFREGSWGILRVLDPDGGGDRLRPLSDRATVAADEGEISQIHPEQILVLTYNFETAKEEMQQEEVPARALHERADGRAVRGSLCRLSAV